MTLQRARALRKAMTPPELRLWNALRLRPAGFKFRRQHPVGAFVVDYYCSTAALAVEVDGAVHEMGNRPAKDQRRDLWLGERGIAVVRYAATDVRDELQAVVDDIVDRCRSRTPR